jgi:RNA polymerase sigma-70 factor (ECF subfamily)
MTDSPSLEARFEENRAHLRGVALRMLGSRSEADDAVQEAWLRLSRSDTSDVANLGGWLTTVVARVCLDMLRARRARREDNASTSEPVDPSAPDDALVLADSVSTALLVVLETLDPAERLAFVLHDTFGVSFDEIAPIVDRTPAAARQLASRARRRVQGVTPRGETDREKRRAIVDAFLAASRSGDFAALLALLDPDVVVRADPTAVSFGAKNEMRGASEVVLSFLGRAQGARPTAIDGVPGAAWIVDGRAKVVFDFTIDDGRITRIDLLADPEVLGSLDLVFPTS